MKVKIMNDFIKTKILFLMVISFSVEAQIQDDSLQEIIVTATRLDGSILDVARSVSIIDKDQIQLATQQLGLDEALLSVPGLYMQNRYNFSQDLRISLRGFGARSSFGIRGVKVIVDGIPETLPDGQSGVDSIDLGSAQTIEVLRGPASSIYGNSAGGVIAVNTQLDTENPFVEGRLARGNFGYQQLQFKSGGSFGQVDYLFNVSDSDIGGYRDHSYAKGNLINSKLRYSFNETDKLLVSLNITDQPYAQDPGGINIDQLLGDRRSARDRNIQFDAGEDLSQERLGLIYEKDNRWGTFILRNYYAWKNFSNKLPFTNGGSVDLDRSFSGIGFQYAFNTLFDRLDMIFGIDYDQQDDHRERYDNNDGILGPLVFDQNERVDNLGIFGQGKFALNEKISVLSGLRYDKISYGVSDYYVLNGDDSGSLDFSEISPSLGLNYKVNKGVLYALYASSFETPTTTELANPSEFGGFNQSLRPQIAKSFELGYKYSSNSLSYELAAFRIDLNDELIPYELEAFPGRQFFSNAGSSTRDGVEAAFTWRNQAGLILNGSYTWSDFVFNQFMADDGQNFNNKYLPGVPKRFGYLGATYKNEKGFSGTFEVFYSGRLYANNSNSVSISSYKLANIRLSKELRFGRRVIRPYLGLNNIFNEKYNSNIRINAWGGRYYEPAPERNIYIGIMANFIY